MSVAFRFLSKFSAKRLLRIEAYLFSDFELLDRLMVPVAVLPIVAEFDGPGASDGPALFCISVSVES